MAPELADITAKFAALAPFGKVAELGSDAVLVVTEPFQLSNADDTGLKQVELSSTVHLAFHEFEFGDLPLCRKHPAWAAEMLGNSTFGA